MLLEEQNMVYHSQTNGVGVRNQTVCIIGAGFSGICAAVQLRKEIPSCEFTIFDENKEVGGTWWMNTYPGAAPDIGSHLYSYSFEPNPGWSQSYSPQVEVLKYLQNVANKYDLYSCIKFEHSVQRLIWDDKAAGWQLTVLNKQSGQREHLFFDILITAQGRFHYPKVPEEFLSFKGQMMHSAEWDPEVELKGRKVAVIGSASSAAQIIPNIVDKVDKLFVYQRHATWVVPRMQFKFPEIVKWSFKNVPGLAFFYRVYLYFLYHLSAPCFRPDTIPNKIAKLIAKWHLWNQVNDPKIREKLTPDYEFGCKRVTPTSEYYPSFNRPNCELITSKITQVTSNAIVTEDGMRNQIDVLILATGFMVQDTFGSMDIRGVANENLFSSWISDRPKSYLGIMNSNTPNLFMLLGPNTAIGYTSILFPLECQVHWMINVLKEMRLQSASRVSVKKSAEDEYMNDIDTRIKGTILGSGKCRDCNTWYLNSKGIVTELFPGTTMAFWDNTKQVNHDHLKYN